jgi:phosphoadenosine phosphosulfate reductase
MTVLAAELDARVLALHARLAEITAGHERVVFSTSFGAEDMVLLDVVARHFRSIALVTLDTGRLPVETYAVWRESEQRYARKIAGFVPAAPALEAYVRINGVNAFYDSVTQRKQCCEIRKVEPLSRALAGHGAWITGQRRAQSAARAHLAFSEFDAQFQIAKFNPLADWSENDVWAYIAGRDVPYNALHDKGYPSIGCAPCTRAIQPGEDLRAGRWWWESGTSKECGLHARREAVSA